MEDLSEFYRIPGAIQTGKDKIVHIEDLIMKIAVVERIIYLQSKIDYIFEDDPELIESINEWAVSGMLTNLFEVKCALESGLYGYDRKYHYSNINKTISD